jgi:hypothetical protein
MNFFVRSINRSRGRYALLQQRYCLSFRRIYVGYRWRRYKSLYKISSTNYTFFSPHECFYCGMHIWLRRINHNFNQGNNHSISGIIFSTPTISHYLQFCRLRRLCRAKTPNLAAAACEKFMRRGLTGKYTQTLPSY